MKTQQASKVIWQMCFSQSIYTHFTSIIQLSNFFFSLFFFFLPASITFFFCRHAPQMCVKPAEIERRKCVQAVARNGKRRREEEPSSPSPAVDARLSFVPPNLANASIAHQAAGKNAAASISVIYTKSGWRKD